MVSFCTTLSQLTPSSGVLCSPAFPQKATRGSIEISSTLMHILYTTERVFSDLVGDENNEHEYPSDVCCKQGMTVHQASKRADLHSCSGITQENSDIFTKYFPSTGKTQPSWDASILQPRCIPTLDAVQPRGSAVFRDLGLCGWDILCCPGRHLGWILVIAVPIRTVFLKACLLASIAIILVQKPRTIIAMSCSTDLYVRQVTKVSLSIGWHKRLSFTCSPMSCG